MSNDLDMREILLGKNNKLMYLLVHATDFDRNELNSITLRSH